MTDIQAALENMKNRFNQNAAAGLNIIFQFSLSDGKDFYTTIKNQTCTISDGQSADAHVTLSMDSATLTGLMDGSVDGMQAFMAGKIQTEGQSMLALKLGELFSG